MKGATTNVDTHQHFGTANYIGYSINNKNLNA